MSTCVGPVSLRSCGSHDRCINEGGAGKLSLPIYQQIQNGEIVLRYTTTHLKYTSYTTSEEV
ncbi:hypothetical protein N7537_012009 [Penicillium hordei]|uniref:Uncharacterized protein n=1 Tax=Penicillium hordei TaxID=40994 RepID=A0AAD6DMX5_9EURO|nr:uncharacterized protein N7537_012009 [Penicillium hordei]KAJ5589331.1 hypothetical protein N7537_012009 [Penicillium hordei]